MCHHLDNNTDKVAQLGEEVSRVQISGLGPMPKD